MSAGSLMLSRDIAPSDTSALTQRTMTAIVEKPSDSSLNFMVYQCVDKTLTDLLGGQVKETMFDYLERERGLPRTEIPMHLNELSELLELALGKTGATVEHILVENLYLKLGWKCPKSVPKASLVDFIKLTKEGTTANRVPPRHSAPGQSRVSRRTANPKQASSEPQKASRSLCPAGILGFVPT